MLYQAILDAAQYVESTKPLSTIKYVSSEGENAFIQVNGKDIKNRDLKVFVTDRADDLRNLQDIRGLSQEMLQNGASAYEIIKFYNTTSMRKMEQIAKKLKDQNDQMQQQAMQQKQQELDQQQKQHEAELEQAAQQHESDQENQDNQNDLDRINKREIALITALAGKNDPFGPTTPEGEPDILAYTSLQNDQAKDAQDHDLENRKFLQQQKEHSDKMGVEYKKIQAEKERTKADLAKGRMELKKAKIAKAAQAKKTKK